jgi:hypothetical protein
MGPWILIFLLGAGMAGVLCWLDWDRRDLNAGYLFCLFVAAVLLVTGVVGTLAHMDDGPKGMCRQRGGVPTQVGRSWVCLAPGSVR